MAHGYRNLQHWNQWLPNDFLGRTLLNAESVMLTQLLCKHYGKHALLIGVPNQFNLLQSTLILYHSLLTPLMSQQNNSGDIESDLHELPILTGSVDLVLLPHTLEFIDNPRQLLAEACRIIKPEGLIVICGFNPYSFWGMKRLFTKDKLIPWSGHFIASSKLKNWLQLVDFEMETHHSILHTPPFRNEKWFKKFQFINKIGSPCFPQLGGVYILLARAKLIPLTPIRMKWKQHLNGIRIPTSITGHVAR